MIYPKSHSKAACPVLKLGALTPSLEPSFTVTDRMWEGKEGSSRAEASSGPQGHGATVVTL